MPDTEQADFTPLYDKFTDDVLAQVRRETYREDDLGQYSWTVRAELESLWQALGLDHRTRLLDVACGAAGPSRFAARLTRCRVVGLDNNEEAVATAARLAQDENLQDLATFQVADGARALPFEDDSFDAVLCIDAIVLLPGRLDVLREWARVLRPGGRLAFTDPGVLTGIATLDELTARASRVGAFAYSPPGQNELLLNEAGFELVQAEDSTPLMEQLALAWHEARARHRSELEKIEGPEGFLEGQRFFDGTRRLAAERRQSRITYVAELGG